MTRRPPHGATRGPQLARPGNGYGRPVRPRPPARLRKLAAAGTDRAWRELEALLAAGHPSDDATITL